MIPAVQDGYSLELCDPREDSDAVIAERCDFSNALQREVLPDEPPTPVEQAITSVRSTPARVRMWSFRVRDSAGHLVASGGTRTDPESETNPDIFFVNISVLPEHRRRGLGSRLLAELAGLARAEGRTRFLGSTNERVAAGEAFARSYGAEAKLADHLNHLPTDQVDRGLLERWVAEAPSRAPEYDLLAFDGRVPDDILEDFVDLVLVLNTAPRDDLEIEDFTLTPAQLREEEERRDAVGTEAWTVVARHKESGELAGFHDVEWNPANPKVVWVGATGVKPEHRGHALGKWLKAVMTLRVLDERPDVADIRTGNADSNDAMLGINKAMGYRPMIALSTWELAVDEVERRLRAKGYGASAVTT